MEVVGLLIIGGVSTVGMAGIARVVYIGTFTFGSIFRRKKKKKTLKEQLYKSIKDLDYIDFVNTLYEIKNYDEEYHKTLFLKVKKQFFFTDRQIEDKDYFMKRFNDSYTQSDEKLLHIIHSELSILLAAEKSRFNL